MTDLAIVGLGSMGSATAWAATRQGLSVVGFEQFDLGHERGASHDTSRILRHSYHTPAYVDLTFDAYEDWADLEWRRQHRARVRELRGELASSERY